MTETLPQSSEKAKSQETLDRQTVTKKAGALILGLFLSAFASDAHAGNLFEFNTGQRGNNPNLRVEEPYNNDIIDQKIYQLQQQLKQTNNPKKIAEIASAIKNLQETKNLQQQESLDNGKLLDFKLQGKIDCNLPGGTFGGNYDLNNYQIERTGRPNIYKLNMIFKKGGTFSRNLPISVYFYYDGKTMGVRTGISWCDGSDYYKDKYRCNVYKFDVRRKQTWVTKTDDGIKRTYKEFDPQYIDIEFPTKTGRVYLTLDYSESFRDN